MQKLVRENMVEASTTTLWMENVHDSKTAAGDKWSIVHSDVCGKLSARTSGGGKYFLAFIDDCTHYTWAYILKSRCGKLLLKGQHRVMSSCRQWKWIQQSQRHHNRMELESVWAKMVHSMQAFWGETLNSYSCVSTEQKINKSCSKRGQPMKHGRRKGQQWTPACLWLHVMPILTFPKMKEGNRAKKCIFGHGKNKKDIARLYDPTWWKKSKMWCFRKGSQRKSSMWR